MRYGVRAWKVGEEGELKSTNWDYTWEAGVLVAGHIGRTTPAMHYYVGGDPMQVREVAPHPIGECPQGVCGFYSYSSYEASDRSWFSTGCVMGIVLIGGVVMAAKVDPEQSKLEGEHWRYRSEKARIVALCEDQVADGKGARIDVERYRVPLISREELKAFVAIEMDDPGLNGVW